MASMTIELSEYVIDAIANAVVKKMQEPCDYYDADNKTCRKSEVPKESCEDVLDKIRTEIMNLDCIDEDKYEGTSIDPQISRDDVLAIIDKYRTESEVKDESI